MALKDILNISFEYVPKAGHRQLPELSKDYESNIPGLYIVGDLADAPVIKISLNQGYEITSRIAEKPDAYAASQAKEKEAEDALDVLIVGAGPAGMGCAIACIDKKLSYVVLEKEKPFNTIQNYPKHKHVFAEPKPLSNQSRIWFEDTSKEDLIERWDKLIEDQGIKIQQPEEVTDIKKDSDGFFSVTSNQNTYRAKRVMLAIGRRGTVRKLGIPGEERVDYGLGDPADYQGKKILIVGGGDSAVEAAVALSEADGTEVGISYRQDGFFRVKEGNRQKITEKIREGKIKPYLQSNVLEISPDTVKLQTKDGNEETISNDNIFVMIGGEPPIPFLKKIGIKMEGTWDFKRALWLIFTFGLVYFVYGVKKPIWPFDPKTVTNTLDSIGLLDTFRTYLSSGIPKNDVGWTLQEFFTIHSVNLLGVTKNLGPSFWYTVLYTVTMYIFGIQAMFRWKSRHQRMRYISLLGFQTFFAFLIPEFFAKYIFALVDKGIQSWKFYAVANPWPLAGTWSYTNSSYKFLIIMAFISFLVIPIFTIFHGKRFCTWLCGCGGLAETLGDRWRHLAPKSADSRKAEWQGTVILGLAFFIAIIILLDAFKFITGDSFKNAASFAKNYYDFIVDFWLIAVIPVALYPFFGGKIWCRFWCPMAKYMQLVSKWFGRLKIKSNEKCIGCGECTRYCQVGIDVQSFAQKKEDFSNKQTSCIHCGICIEVCPMEVLSFDSGKNNPAQKSL